MENHWQQHNILSIKGKRKRTFNQFFEMAVRVESKSASASTCARDIPDGFWHQDRMTLSCWNSYTRWIGAIPLLCCINKSLNCARIIWVLLCYSKNFGWVGLLLKGFWQNFLFLRAKWAETTSSVKRPRGRKAQPNNYKGPQCINRGVDFSGQRRTVCSIRLRTGLSSFL